jgi:hypothetical protein
MPAASLPDDSAAVPSPCVSVCKMDTRRGLCTGCARSLDEIAGWARYSDAEKRAVWRRIAERRAQV